MAAYASVLSLAHLMQKIQHHPRPPISLDEDLIKSLTQNITFFQDFLERYSHVGSKEARRGLESRIAAAAYSAEDMIGSHVVDLIKQTRRTRTRGRDFSSLQSGKESTSVVLYERLQKVAEEMDSIKNEVDVEEIKGKSPLQHSNLPAGSLRLPPSTRENTMVGFHDILIDVMDKLTRDRDSNRQIIPIVGTGGIGKTTLAHNAYVKPLIVQYFDIRAWVTVSQEYSMRDILIGILSSLEKQESRERYSSMSEGDMGGQLHKHLYGRRYLIVMDDVWSIDAWDMIKLFLPDNCNGSRIMITTRESQLASSLVGSDGLMAMKFLDEAESWTLLSRKIFLEETCPVELEEIGKKIAINCKGLPLSISVIGGLLAKSSFTKEHWDYVAQHLSSIVNSEENQRCLEILSMSYIYLPVHLKPCFLYMGVFSEDYEIRVSDLVKLWVSEGFLKPIGGKSIEVVAKDYLKDLIDRNLILVHKQGRSGNIKSCKIHDLLRDMCLREGQTEMFHCVGRNIELQMPKEVTYSVLKSLPLVGYMYRYKLSPSGISSEEVPYILNHEWNLQTVIDVVYIDYSKSEPLRIWKMPHLRHVQLWNVPLEDPSSCQGDNRGDDIILENLQSLKGIKNFRFNEEVVKRIPNINLLKIEYDIPGEKYSLNNLVSLHKLESLSCWFDACLTEGHPSWRYMAQSLTFSHSLKKLALAETLIPWEDITMKLSSLPHLEVLELQSFSCIGKEWNLEEDHQFRSLKCLLIKCSNMEQWRAGSINFPCLEQLVLCRLHELKNFPKDIGDITTLRSIRLVNCSHTSIISVKEMAEEQEEFGNAELRVQVRAYI